MKKKIVLKREVVRVLSGRCLATVVAGDAAVYGMTKGSLCDPTMPPQ